jgi:hypothetical protein
MADDKKATEPAASVWEYATTSEVWPRGKPAPQPQRPTTDKRWQLVNTTFARFSPGGQLVWTWKLEA